MKVWRRVMKNACHGDCLEATADIVTDVDLSGNYYTRLVWSDGNIRGEHRMTLSEMGYSSVQEFIKERRHTGFVLVENAVENEVNAQ